MQYQSSIVSLAPLQLAVANTSLQCMCCLGNTMYLAQGCVLFRSVPFCARLGLALQSVQSVPAVHSLGHLQLNIVAGQRKVQKYFLLLSLSLSLTLFRFSLLLLVFMVCQLTRLLHLFNTNRVQLGKPKGTQQGGRVCGGRWLL